MQIIEVDILELTYSPFSKDGINKMAAIINPDYSHLFNNCFIIDKIKRISQYENK